MKGLMKAVFPWLGAMVTTFVVYILSVLILRVVLRAVLPPEYIPDNIWMDMLFIVMFIGTTAFGIISGMVVFYKIRTLCFRKIR